MKLRLKKKTTLTIALFFTFTYLFSQNTTTVKFETPGSGSWTVPTCVTQITVHVYGGGGGGGGTSSRQTGTGSDYEACTGGGDGGGGGYSSITYTVTPGTTFNFTVGAGGNGGTGTDNNAAAGNGGNGGTSTFNGPTLLSATGGTGGTGATANNTSGNSHIGDNGVGGNGGNGSGGAVNFNGGKGSTAYHSASCADLSGAGGGGAGPGGNGGNAQQIGGCPHSSEMNGGTGQTPGGIGGNGIKGSINANRDVKDGKPGNGYGGGGGGGNIHLNSWANQWQKTNGGKGGNGAVIITYESSAPVTPTTTVIQPSCTTPTGSATVTNTVTGATYTLTGTSPAVPAQSNGTGSFSNLAPGTYEIKAEKDGCESTNTLVVNSLPANTTPAFTPVPAICVGGSFTLPTTSNNGIQGSWTPAINNQQATVYTFTPNTGQCANTTTMMVDVNQPTQPVFTQIPDVCVGSSFSLPTTSNGGVTGSWSPAPNSNQETQYTFTPNANQCATTTQMTVGVTNEITPLFSQVAPVCTGGTIQLPATSTNNITGSWSPAINNQETTEYTFTPNANQCATTTQMTVAVNSSILPTFTQVEPICAGTNFTLPNASNNSVTGSWSPAINNQQTTTYTFNPDGTQGCATTTQMTVTVNTSVTPQFTQIPAICAGETFTLPSTSTNGISGSWAPAVNNQQTTIYTFTPNGDQCANTATMTVTVNPSITATFTQIPPICEGETFTLPTTSNNGMSGTWSPAVNNQQTTQYTFTPSSGGNCVLPTTMTVTVNAQATPLFNLPSGICKGESLSFPSTSTNGIQGTWTPSFNNTQTTNYTFTPSGAQCASPIQHIIAVSDLKFEVTTNDVTCNGNDGSAIVTILEGTAPFTYQWSNGSSDTIASQLATGNYSVTLTDANNCQKNNSFAILSDGGMNISSIVIPNIITPNNDGVNDVFTLPSLGNPCVEMEIRILNRWGVEVFNMTEDEPVFSGNDQNDKPLTEGIYFYQIHSDNIGCKTAEKKDNCSGFIHVVK